MEARVRIVIHSASREELLDILRREDLDLGCGGTKRTPTGEWSIEAFVSPEVASRLASTLPGVEVDRQFGQRLNARSDEVGSGDRFNGGKTPPRGIGRKE